jgi:VWFA-related protein
MHRKLFRAAVIALLPTALLAQGPAPVATTLTAPRVLDVVVTDSRGKHIPGLTSADFRILQDGKTQEITKFAELNHAAGAPDTHPPRMILAAFDMSSLSMQGRRKCVAAVRQLLKSRARSNDRVMIAQVSAVGAATPVATWTSDPAEIERQLGVIDGLGVSDRTFERKNTEQSIEMAVRTDRDAGQSSGITFESLMTTARHYASTAQAESRRTVSAIQDVLGLMGEGPGKKILILGGGGLSTRPGSEMFEYLETVKMQAETGQTGPGVAGDARRANPRAEISHYEISQDVRDVAQTARNHGIVVYALQPDTSGSTQLAVERIDVSNTSADFAGVADQMSGYSMLTAITGGVPLLGGAPESAVAAISADFDAHYSLSFQETIPAVGALPNVDVKLTKPGYRLRSAFAGGPVTKDSEVKDAVVANQIGVPASNDMNIAVKSDEPVPDGINRKVTLTVMIPVKSIKLMPAVDEMVGGFTVYISTGDAQGHASAVNRQTKEVRFPSSAVPQMLEKSIGFRVEVTLIPGRTQISVGVLDTTSEQTGFAKVVI